MVDSCILNGLFACSRIRYSHVAEPVADNLSVSSEMKRLQGVPKLVSAIELKRRCRNDLWLKVLVNILYDLPDSGL